MAPPSPMAPDKSHACLLPRWPRVASALRTRAWRIHRLARALESPPSQVHAWLYGRDEMPEIKRRQTEDLLDLTPGELG